MRHETITIEQYFQLYVSRLQMQRKYATARNYITITYLYGFCNLRNNLISFNYPNMLTRVTTITHNIFHVEICHMQFCWISRC